MINIPFEKKGEIAVLQSI